MLIKMIHISIQFNKKKLNQSLVYHDLDINKRKQTKDQSIVGTVLEFCFYLVF